MLAATFLAIFFVPLFFRVLTDRRLREPRSSAELKAEIGHARDLAHKPTEHPHVAPR
jgi:hypothetical protein